MRFTILGAGAALAATLAFSACSGGSGSTMPSASGMTQTSLKQLQRGDRLTILGVRPDAKCPSRKLSSCFTIAQGGSLTVFWCYGTPSAPCGDTSDYAWSGLVCKPSAIPNCTANPVSTRLISSVAWTGPFPCTPSTCGTGTYELDTITAGSRLRGKGQYWLAQEIDLDGSPSTYIGLNSVSQ